MAERIDPDIDLLREKIRSGTEADNPMLIILWLSMDQPAGVTTFISINEKRAYLEAQFRLLLDTITDEIVPAHWRRACLDNIYRPLSSLKRLSDSDQSEQRLRQLLTELSVSCRYVQSGLHS